jgi:hypothetical protein
MKPWVSIRTAPLAQGDSKTYLPDYIPDRDRQCVLSPWLLSLVIGSGVGYRAANGKRSTVGLASAIAVPWMTTSGSLLANWWQGRRVE